jgi:hypothetical protein
MVRAPRHAPNTHPSKKPAANVNRCTPVPNPQSVGTAAARWPRRPIRKVPTVAHRDRGGIAEGDYLRRDLFTLLVYRKPSPQLGGRSV